MNKFGLLASVSLLTGCVTASQLEQASVSEFAKMRETLTISTNDRDRAYVQCIADSIVAQLDEPYASYDWDVELFDEAEKNAFAMPGGQIGVFTGIFEVAQTQDQLAAVMGHEVAHVTLGHSLKRANSQTATNLGILVGSVASEVVRDNVGLILLGAQVGLLLPFSRSQESEADLAGLELMATAGFRPEASVDLWRNMAAANSSSTPSFLSTHPSSANRIESLGEQVAVVMPQYQRAQAAGLRPACSR